MAYTFAVPAYMAAASEDVQKEQLEKGEELFAENCVSCHGEVGEGTDIAPALSEVEFLKQVRDDFLFATITYGRQPRSDMPAWGLDGGGPFTDEEVHQLVAHIRHWEDNPPPPPVVIDGAIGTDLSVELPEGDATRGEELYTDNGCVACHNGTIGPATEDSAANAANAANRVEGYSAEQYLHESIVLPGAYIVEEYEDVMPKNFGDKTTPQDVADLIAYILSLK
jgi:mono/diheme cytochrome c family protein